MFAWFWNLFRRRDIGIDYYHPGERLIYRYFNGEKTVFADPLVIYAAIVAKSDEMSREINALKTDFGSQANDITKDAHDSLVAKVRKIFDIKPWDGEKGLTERESLDLFDHFLIYKERLKKNSSTPPISPMPMASEPSFPEAAGQPMPNSLGSGSIGNGSISDALPSSPKASPSLTDFYPQDSTITLPSATP